MYKVLSVLTLTFALLHGNEEEWTKYKHNVLLHQKEASGWCKKDKAEKMMDLIHEVHPEICVEVGVFGGSSIYPTAQALKYIDKGIVHAIDPWENVDCIKGYNSNDPNYKWWQKVDLEKVHQGFLTLLTKYQLTEFCSTMVMTSEKAVVFFEDESIDILHIDGNHTSEISCTDAEIWYPKVKQGGYIWFDDINWASTLKAQSYLNERCALIDAFCVGDECYLYRKLNDFPKK